MQTLKFKTQLMIAFFAAAIIATTTNGAWKKETNKMDQNLPITTHRRDLFELVEVSGPREVRAKVIDVSEERNRSVRMLLQGTVTNRR